MQKSQSGRVLLAMLFFFLMATAVVAADRTIWKHDGGTFSKGKGDNWVERGGDKTFFFKETARTDDYVELQGLKRNIKVRLKNKVALIQEEQGKPFKLLYNGMWVDK